MNFSSTDFWGTWFIQETMTIIYILLFLVTVYSYIVKNYKVFLLCYTGLITNLFMLDSIGGSIRGSDLCILANILLLPRAFLLRKKEKSYDKKANYVATLFVFFILFEFTRTIFLGVETIVFSLKVVRIPLMFLAYFVFSTIPLEKYKTFFRIMLYISLVQGGLFILQFLGLQILAGTLQDDVYEFSYALNIPTFIYLYIFFCMENKFTKSLKYIYVMFFFVIITLTFVRGIILSTLLSFFVYLFFQRGIKHSIPIIFGVFCLLPVIIGNIEKKEVETSYDASTIEELKLAFSGVDGIRDSEGKSGSFGFRLAMFVERVDYLVENPKYLLFGVGAIHEDSPNCYNRFEFKLGTQNEERYYGRCLIESGDITWVPIVLRYGFVGLLVHFLVIWKVISWSRSRNDNLRIICPLFLLYFLLSFIGSLFENPIRLWEMTIYMSLLSRCQIEKKEFYM